MTIGERNSSFPGMLMERQLQIVLVSPNHGIGIEITSRPDKIIKYQGKAQTTRF